MPHPERAADALLGSDDGLPILRSLVEAAARAERSAGNRAFARGRPMIVAERPAEQPRPGEPAVPAPPSMPLHRALGLTDDELDAIRDRLGRDPNDLELAMFSVMWSEHCSYKSSKPLLRDAADAAARASWRVRARTPASSRSATAWRSRSSSSRTTTRRAVEPYQGAATGVGGILRDIFTMGARPIAVLDALRFGDPADARTRHLVDGVVRGVGGYGNCVGVPTVGGELVFDPSYARQPARQRDGDRPARGAPPHPRRGARARATSRSCSGARPAATGSAERRSSPPRRSRTRIASKRPSVQVGDPFAEKLLIEASLELIERGLVEGLQDLGAAGITCATSETADRAGTGIRVDLDAIPRREPGMAPFEVMISESQERMLAIVRPERLRGGRGGLRALGPAVRRDRAGDRRRRHHDRVGRARATGAELARDPGPAP